MHRIDGPATLLSACFGRSMPFGDDVHGRTSTSIRGTSIHRSLEDAQGPEEAMLERTILFEEAVRYVPGTYRFESGTVARESHALSVNVR